MLERCFIKLNFLTSYVNVKKNTFLSLIIARRYAGCLENFNTAEVCEDRLDLNKKVIYHFFKIRSA